MRTRQVLVESRSNSFGIEVRLEYRSITPSLVAYQLGDEVALRVLAQDGGWRRGALSYLARGLKSATKEALALALDEGLRVLRDTREAA